MKLDFRFVSLYCTARQQTAQKTSTQRHDQPASTDIWSWCMYQRNQKHSGFTKSFITSRILFPILLIEIRKFSSTFNPDNQPNQSSQYHPTPASIQVPYDLPLLPITAMMSPYSTNISRLTTTILDNFGERIAYLQQLDPGCVLDLSKNGVIFAYYKSRDPTSSPNVTHSEVYRSSHGRTRCRMACKDSELFSNNYGYHSYWQQYFSTECKGGLCECLRDYSDYGYYGWKWFNFVMYLFMPYFILLRKKGDATMPQVVLLLALRLSMLVPKPWIIH